MLTYADQCWRILTHADVWYTPRYTHLMTLHSWKRMLEKNVIFCEWINNSGSDIFQAYVDLCQRRVDIRMQMCLIIKSSCSSTSVWEWSRLGIMWYLHVKHSHPWSLTLEYLFYATLYYILQICNIFPHCTVTSMCDPWAYCHGIISHHSEWLHLCSKACMSFAPKQLTLTH